MSQMLTLTSRKGKELSSGDGILIETSGRYEEKEKGVSGAEDGKEARVTTMEISSPLTQKAERVMGIKAQEIHVKRNVDVDVENVASRDERGPVSRRQEGRQER